MVTYYIPAATHVVPVVTNDSLHVTSKMLQPISDAPMAIDDERVVTNDDQWYYWSGRGDISKIRFGPLEDHKDHFWHCRYLF